MQLDKAVVFRSRVDVPTNDSFYVEEKNSLNSTHSQLSHDSQPVVMETMQESLALKQVGSMAEVMPLWKRLYAQWSKQLLQL
jgi:hypothetical protein